MTMLPMKIAIRKIIILSIIAALFLLMGKWNHLPPTLDFKNINDSNTISALRSSSRSDLSFFVAGDIHTDTAALDNVIKDMCNINPKADALILNGDIVDQGLDREYTAVMSCLESNALYLPGIIVKNIGNHEFYDFNKGLNTKWESDNFISTYLKFAGEERVYHSRWIKGYHFISLGSENTYTSETGTLQASISKEQQKWLVRKLSENYKRGRSIMVFLHQHLSAVKEINEVNSILSKYPEVILFSSHTHTFLEANNIAYLTKPYKALHTGAVHHPVRWGARGRKALVEGSQGLYVEASGKKVTVKARDFLNRKWVGE